MAGGVGRWLGDGAFVEVRPRPWGGRRSARELARVITPRLFTRRLCHPRPGTPPVDVAEAVELQQLGHTEPSERGVGGIERPRPA